MTSNLLQHRFMVVLLAAITFAASHAVSADPPAEPISQENIQRLVEQLADDSFVVREQASDELRRIGAASMPALRKAASTGELEARYRAGLLMEEIEALEHERRLLRFLEQPGGDADSPTGWETFRDVIGEEHVARPLFAEAQRTEPELFRLLEKESDRLLPAYESRIVELQHRYVRADDRRPLMKHLMPLLFIAALAELPVGERTGSTLYSFLNYHEFQQVIGDGARGTAVRKVLGYWIAQPGGASATLKVNLSLQQNLSEGLEPALRVVREGKGSDLQFAILTVGRFGSQEHVAALEPLLSNHTVLTASRGRPQPSYTCQVRDTALAVMVSLTGQDPREYGFARISRNERYLFSPASTGFQSDEERAAAVARWNKWKESAPVAAPSP